MPKTINISAADACVIAELAPNQCLISINEEHGNVHKLLVEGDNVLQVFFGDVNGHTKLQNGQELSGISTETAREIIFFIEKNLNKEFIIHCFAGVSRSAAICIFMNLIYKYDLKSMYWYCSEPNRFVLGQLMIEWARIRDNFYGDN